jgi:hypothetical protein
MNCRICFAGLERLGNGLGFKAPCPQIFQSTTPVAWSLSRAHQEVSTRGDAAIIFELRSCCMMLVCARTAARHKAATAVDDQGHLLFYGGRLNCWAIGPITRRLFSQPYASLCLPVILNVCSCIPTGINPDYGKFGDIFSFNPTTLMWQFVAGADIALADSPPDYSSAGSSVPGNSVAMGSRMGSTWYIRMRVVVTNESRYIAAALRSQ